MEMPHPHAPANLTAVSQQGPHACDPGSHLSFRPTSSLKVPWSFHLLILSIRVTESSRQSWSCAEVLSLPLRPVEGAEPGPDMSSSPRLSCPQA